MGGRETGGLVAPAARATAWSPSPSDRAAMEAHWGVPADAPGISPDARACRRRALRGARGRARQGRLDRGTNPLVSPPDGQRVRGRARRAELVVVPGPHHPTETSALAHAVLPAAAVAGEGGHDDELRAADRARARALAPPGEALPDWEIFAALARHLGYGDAVRLAPTPPPSSTSSPPAPPGGRAT